MGEESHVEYGADVFPASLDYAGSYATEGGSSSDGEIGFDRPPDGARRVWFDFSASGDPEGKQEVTRLTFDLATGHVTTGLNTHFQ